ncbi:MAG: amino acid permease [Bacteroidales bacterium]|jgi:APA family basic amino acid/polyamine antiporter
MLSKGLLARIGIVTSTSFVVANMIGGGVFGSLGYQLAGIHDMFSIMLLWIIGGLMALCGALCYGELGAAMPRSGGEYHYLSKIYHPAVGFLSGWVSVTVGFAAPVAATCILFGGYAKSIFPVLSPVLLAISVLILITTVHSIGIYLGSRFQNIFTILEILLILVFIFSGFFLTPESQKFSVMPTSSSLTSIFSSSFAVSLVFISYAYSGWNASAYIAGEINEPQKKLPRSLLTGTLLVTVLYVFLNYIFLYSSPVSELVNQKEIGFISANNIFGAFGGRIMGAMISILLISSISSMIFVGPRVTQVMGEDIPSIKFLSIKNLKGIPVYAIALQFIISLFFILTSTFSTVITYIGFTLNLFTFLTVLGLFVHRYKFKNTDRPYKTLGYPVTPIIFLIILLWILVRILLMAPLNSFIDFIKNPAIAGFGTVLSGLIFYYLSKIKLKKEN